MRRPFTLSLPAQLLVELTALPPVDLDQEVLKTIFANLLFVDLLSVGCVCKSWSVAASDPVLWRRKTGQDKPNYLSSGKLGVG